MLIEVCIFSAGLHAGAELYKKFKKKINEIQMEARHHDSMNEKRDYNERKTPSETKSGPFHEDKIIEFALDMEVKYQKLMQDKVDPLFGNTRDMHLKEISGKEQLSEEEKAINRKIGIAAGNLSLAAVCQLFYPPMIIVTVPTMLWVSSTYFKEAFHAIFKERRISIAFLDSLLVILGILSGYILAAVLSNFLFCLSRKLLSRTKDSSRKKLVNVFYQHRPTAWIIVDGVDIEIPFEQLRTGDLVVVNAGEIISVDGVITSGMASVDQRALTGESQPVEKGIGDQILAASLVLSGKIIVRAERAGNETSAAKIGDILSQTTEYKTSFESKAERIVDQSILPTLGISALALPVVGAGGALAILLTNVGYNMRILAPLSTLNFLGFASHGGILIKDGSALEGLTRVDTIVFDKTGTLTLDQPQVGKIYSCNGFSEDTLLTFTAAAEYRQTHPIARAILAEARRRGLNPPKIDEGRYEIGYGISVTMDESVIKVGSGRFMEMEGIFISDEIKDIRQCGGLKGYSLVMAAVDGELAGAIELRPAIRPEARQLTQQLRKYGISTYIISGDIEAPTQALAQELGIDCCFANTLPEEKAEIVSRLREEGKTVCFVGDGINDSIALKKADVSVSLRGASTVATDTAQIVLMDEDLTHLIRLLDIARNFKSDQKRNMIISIAPGVICIGGVFLFYWGIYASMLLYFGSLGIGVLNAVHPAGDRKSEPEC